MSACSNGHSYCLRLLLKDSRVDANEPDVEGSTPLRMVAASGHLDFIKWWIASGREMHLGEPGKWRTDAIGVAKKYGYADVVALLGRFKSDAGKTRSEVRLELGITAGQLLIHFPPTPLMGPNSLFYFRVPCDHTTQANSGRVHCLS